MSSASDSGSDSHDSQDISDLLNNSMEISADEEENPFLGRPTADKGKGKAKAKEVDVPRIDKGKGKAREVDVQSPRLDKGKGKERAITPPPRLDKGKGKATDPPPPDSRPKTTRPRPRASGSDGSEADEAMVVDDDYNNDDDDDARPSKRRKLKGKGRPPGPLRFRWTAGSFWTNPKMWYARGDIILLCEGMGFRVERRRFSMKGKSEVWDDVLMSSGTGEYVEGCEVVRLEDGSKEMYHMLRALFNKR